MFCVQFGIQFKKRSAEFNDTLTSKRRVGFNGINGNI